MSDMSGRDHDILTFTEWVHDRVDAIQGSSMDSRAALGVELFNTCKQVLREGPLTSEQVRELEQARAHILIDCLNVDPIRVARMLERATPWTQAHVRQRREETFA